MKNPKTPEDISDNLSMVSIYWKNKYEKSLADLISPQEKELINKVIQESNVMLKVAREKVFSIEHKGGRVTDGLYSIYNGIDRIMADLKGLSERVNKTEFSLDLNEYPTE